MRFLTNRRLPLPIALVVSVVALVLGSGVGYAAHKIISPDPVTHVIHACYNNSSGTIKLVNTGQPCHHDETAIQWNQTGPAGAAGPAGPAGPPGPSGLSGYEQKSNKVVLAAGATVQVSVKCSAGKKVLGGGFDIETPTFVKVFSSEPSDGAGNFINNGWNVMATNTDTNPRQVTVSAICA